MIFSRIVTAIIAAVATILTGCASTTDLIEDGSKDRNPDSFMIVDCLLPPKVRRLGTRITYAAPRQPIKTAASVCEIRGGEYEAYDRADFRTALAVWLPRAKEGNANAQTYVGEIYEKGLGVAANYELAIQWYEQAAAKGNSRAQLNLGYLYETGLGVERDFATAMNYYRDASGLTDGDLEYVSSVEYANREAAKEKTKLLESQVLTLQQQLKAAEEKYENQKAVLSSEQADLEKLRQTVEENRAQLATASSSTDNATVESLQRIASLSSELQSAQQEQKRLTDKLTEQQLETSELRSRYARDNRDLFEKNAELKSLRVEIEQLNRQVATQQNESNELAPALDAARERAELLDSEINQLRNSQSAQSSEISELLKIAEEAETTLSDALDRQNDEINALTARNNAERAAYEQQLATLQQSLSVSKDEQIRLANNLADSELSQRTTQQENDQLKLSIVQQRSAIQARENERDQLQQKLAELQQSSDVSDSQKSNTARELESLNAELSTSRLELERLSGKLRDEQLSARLAKLDSEQRLAALELALQQREALVAQQQAQLETLESNVSQSRGKLADRDVENVAGVSTVGLTIDIIEPPLLLTRGTPSISAPADGQVKIFGKINPAETLLTFQVNGIEQSVNDNGVFRYVHQRQGPDLNLVAIDDQGNTTRLSLGIDELYGQSNTDESSTPQLAEATPNSDNTQPSRPIDNVDFGNYHALVIGNNDYQTLSTLKTAVNDARSVERLLRESYGFETELLLNANRYSILSALASLQSTLTENDNLLIYYAGHGELDEETESGYWLPTDADAANSENWIANSAVTNLVDAMPAKHVLIVADSCYSGTLTRTSVARQLPSMSSDQKRKWLQAMTRSKVRTVLSSGGVKPVFDGAPNAQHSIFAKVLLDELTENHDILEVYQLFFNVQQKVASAAKDLNVQQTPQYAPIRHSGHEAGEFLFVPSQQQQGSAENIQQNTDYLDRGRTTVSASPLSSSATLSNVNFSTYLGAKGEEVRL